VVWTVPSGKANRRCSNELDQRRLVGGRVSAETNVAAAAKRATSNQLPLLRNTIAKSAEAARAV